MYSTFSSPRPALALVPALKVALVVSTVDLLEPSAELVAGPPAQLVLLAAQEPEPEPSTEFSPETYLPYCEIMRAIVGPLTNESVLLRIQVALALARWAGAPPDKASLARRLGVSAGDLSGHLSNMRERGLIDDVGNPDYYELSWRGRSFIMLLHLLTNPFSAGDATALAKGFWELGHDVGLDAARLDDQYDMLVATLESRVRAMEAARGSDDTDHVRGCLVEAKRDRAIGLELLKVAQAQEDRGMWRLRQQQRMHTVIASIGTVSGQLESHYRQLIRRDLITSGLVSVGDMLAWMQSASLEDLTDAVTPCLIAAPAEPLAEVSAEGLVQGVLALADVSTDVTATHPPAPVPTPALNAEDVADAGLLAMLKLDARLRRQVREQGPTSLADWVDRETWDAAVLHFLVATDPILETGNAAVRFAADPQADYDRNLKGGAVALVTRARLSAEEETDAG